VVDAAAPVATAAPDASAAPAPAAATGTAPAVPAPDEEPDEEALLRTAVPNAENAVIGEGGAEEPGHDRVAAKRAPARPETAILHITSAPSGAVVRTTSRVLGRTPLNIHFRTGNVYEIAFIKAGYETTTRRVAVRGTSDRKIAVSLKKRPPPKRTSFFHPHR
ncbi:MAG TPA: PEGA domain-containing protein, partial [Polyangia bacterium]|nr:PEGA domain-containing protein [Polyangia bacterium]